MNKNIFGKAVDSEEIYAQRVIDESNLLSGDELFQEAVKFLDDYNGNYTDEEKEEHRKAYRESIRDKYIEEGLPVPDYLKDE